MVVSSIFIRPINLAKDMEDKFSIVETRFRSSSRINRVGYGSDASGCFLGAVSIPFCIFGVLALILEWG